MPLRRSLWVTGSRAWRQIEIGMEGDLAVHERLRVFVGEVEKVFECAGVDGDVEADVAAVDVGDANDLAFGNDVGVAKPGVDGLEPGVAVGAVDNGVEFGVEREGVVGDVEGEVGGGGFAVDGDVVELALVAAGGGEHAADAFDGVEVGMAEGVGAADIGVAGRVGVEGAEVAGGIDVADGFGIDEGGVELHGLAAGDGLQG